MIPTEADLQIVSTRIFDAPVELIFRAWTEPQHLQNWWGPNGFTNTFNEFDLRVGGRWSFIMHGSEKGHYHNECEFTEIIKPSLLSWKRHSKPLFNVRVTFEEVAPGKTKVVFKQIFETARECSKVKKFAQDLNEENFDRLEKELKNMSASSAKT